MGSDRHPDASRHFDAAKSAASSAADNSGTALSEVGRAAQAYISETDHRSPKDQDKPSLQEHWSRSEVRQQASDRVEEGQHAAEGVLRNLRQSADEQSQRAKELAAAKIEQGQRSTEDALRNISGTVGTQVQAAQDAASSVAASATDQLKEVTDVAVTNLDRGIHTATRALKSATSKSLAVADEAAVQSRVYYKVGVAQYKVAEDHVFNALKDGVEVALANPDVTSAVLAGLALVALPGPRRFLYRQTWGRLRSDEAVYLAAQRKSQSLGESVEGFTVEAGKLTQRLVSAETQYVDGLRKVKATSKQLQALQKEIAGSERAAQSLVRTLYELPSAQAIALQAEVATKLQAAKMQRKALEKLIYGVTKQGL